EHLMLFVAAPNAHTYRLLIFKDLVLRCEAFCSQQRDEIMKRFLHLVNPSFFATSLGFDAAFREGPNYSKGRRCLARLFDIFSFHRFQGRHLAHHCPACRYDGSAYRRH
ncbi:hypothetical protein, partial [Duganella flavida]|uniref:hypothetical protein n=1 Tax=Duganella flavida TaxID=2692175 RepID=UPI001E38BBAD